MHDTKKHGPRWPKRVGTSCHDALKKVVSYMDHLQMKNIEADTAMRDQMSQISEEETQE